MDQNAGYDLRWWNLDGPDLIGSMNTLIRAIRGRQAYRREADYRHARLYGNYSSQSGNYTNTLRTNSSTGAFRLSINVVKNMCGAATAKVTKNKPKPMFLTNGAEYSQKKLAKTLNKFAEGQFYQLGLYTIAPSVMLDATIYGTGLLKIFAEEGEIKIERVLPQDCLVDEEDGRNQTPRSFYQIHRVDRLVLKALYPDHAQAIENATSRDDYEDSANGLTASGHLTHLVQVKEAWHLRSGKKATDGRHVLVIDNAVLVDESWTKDKFPFAFIRWSPAPMGFWGIGLAEELTGVQLEINKLLREIQLSYHLLGKSHWMVENGSKVVSAHIDNDIGSIIKYSGIAPQVYTPQAVPAEIYQHLWQLYAKAYEYAGISQLQAQSQKPAGLDSGKALRVFSDIQTERFGVVASQYEQFFLTVAEQMIELAREISEEDGGYDVKVFGRHSYEVVKWSDINLKEDEYVMKAYPINALSDDPAERMQQVQEFAKAGWIDTVDAKALLDFPDLEGWNSLEQAAKDTIEDIIERAINKGEYHTPEPMMNLQYSIKKVQYAYLRGRLDGVPEENLALLQQWMSDAQNLLNKQSPDASGAAPPGVGAPVPGNPGPAQGILPGAGAPPPIPGAEMMAA